MAEMAPAIAIVGSACRYADATSPRELWENALAQRRAFRKLPEQRLPASDYCADDPAVPDRAYCNQAAVIADYTFDRVAFRIPKASYDASDLTHWLALDVVRGALSDAGVPDGDGLDRARTGVIIGNTLTGEFSRAGLMRVRWPYVRRTVEEALDASSWDPEGRTAFLAALEARYKAPFPPIGEESLAGGLANTIAGRVCNHFDFGGGGYTVDGACSSSLLAIIQACSALLANDADTMLAGGVDLSLDPFELVGFSKTGALARECMRVFDERSAGFWPGEGCGMLVLMRHEDAVADGRPVLAVIRGWGISSDGSGGLTRPAVAGQRLALARAYERAGFGIDTIELFEGHGTGTAVGDTVELSALTESRRAARATRCAAIGTIKANIGHTKAAAGAAGVLKVVQALATGLLPPTTGCETPHQLLREPNPALRVLDRPEVWPHDRPLRAAVSAMGFGGINAHLVIDRPTGDRKPSRVPARLASTPQDAELFLFSGESPESVGKSLSAVARRAPKLSLSELTDLSVTLGTQIRENKVRVAIVARNPVELSERLHQALRSVNALGGRPAPQLLQPRNGVFTGRGGSARIGFVFPGQGGGTGELARTWSRRFTTLEHLPGASNLRIADDPADTVSVQPRVVAFSAAGFALLNSLGVVATVGIGHSVGELTALHWSGAFDAYTLVTMATARGKAMGSECPVGAMASLRLSAGQTRAVIRDSAVVIGAENGPRHTVISGDPVLVRSVVERLQNEGVAALLIPVARAFHSPMMEAALPAFRDHLARVKFGSVGGVVVSTVTGEKLPDDVDVAKHLLSQVMQPVQFHSALTKASELVDLFIEVGAGATLGPLVSECTERPVISLDLTVPTVESVLKAAGAAFVLGARLNTDGLFADRFSRPFHLHREPNFLTSPCEAMRAAREPSRTFETPDAVAPHEDGMRLADLAPVLVEDASAAPSPGADCVEPTAPTDSLTCIRRLVSKYAELPDEAIGDSDRLLDDLHLNSITVAQIAAEATTLLGLSPLVAPTELANASVLELAQQVERQNSFDSSTDETREASLPGAASWVEPFTVVWTEQPLSPIPPESPIPDRWRVFPPEHPFAHKVARALPPRAGCLVYLSFESADQQLSHLLLAAQTALRDARISHFVLVQQTPGHEAFAKSLLQERSGLTVCVVSAPERPEVADWVACEVRSASGYVESRYDDAGVRKVPRLRWWTSSTGSAHPSLHGAPALDPGKLLLVTGGAKGITAECALALANAWGVRVALIGRAAVEEDRYVQATLERMREQGSSCSYHRGDVRDRENIHRVIADIQDTHGPVVGLLHAAGVNHPTSISRMTLELLEQTLRPKVNGFDNVLASIEATRLRLLVTFGSIIAATGLAGEAHYALANALQTRMTEQFACAHSNCRTQALEFSVWASVGMGERLGTLETLASKGVAAIGLEAGVSIFRRLLEAPEAPSRVVVTSRFGSPPTLAFEHRDLPFVRFLERPRVSYPNAELVVDSTLTLDSDPYLSNHVFQSQPLFPAVMALEAMAQAALALDDTAQPQTFRQVRFERPIVVRPGASETLRVAAARTRFGITLAIRCGGTRFQVDHVRAEYGGPSHDAAVHEAPLSSSGLAPLIRASDIGLYDNLLFQTGRFQRIVGYRHIMARSCEAVIKVGPVSRWFGRAVPDTLVLGDAGFRDAIMHCIQVCVPDAVLLPMAIEELQIHCVPRTGSVTVRATERSCGRDEFTYDIEAFDEHGTLCERWRGLRLKRVADGPIRSAWVPSLLAPYVQRRVQELVSTSRLRVVIENGSRHRRLRTRMAVQRLLGLDASVVRTADGKPETGAIRISASHLRTTTLAVAADSAIGCDIEPIRDRPQDLWRSMLTSSFTLAEQVASDNEEGLDEAAARVWSARESLKKAGQSPEAPLTLSPVSHGEWVTLRSGSFVVATLRTQFANTDGKVILAVATGGSDALF